MTFGRSLKALFPGFENDLGCTANTDVLKAVSLLQLTNFFPIFNAISYLLLNPQQGKDKAGI